jgi:hypothetical protein
MSIEVYPSDFSTRYEITHAISIQMATHYNDIGKLQLVVPVSDYNITALKTGNILFDTVRGTTYIIINTKCDTTDNRITANGYTTDWLLNKRSVAVKRTVKNIESGVYGLINDNLRGLSRVSTADVKGLTETFSGEEAEDATAYGGQLLDEIIPYLNNGELGHRMVWDPSSLSWTFEIFKGKDLTTGIHAIAFAEEQGTCTDLVINEDTSTFKNVAYVKYQLSDGTEAMATVGTATGDNRFEKWFDTSVIQEQDETVDDCRKRAVAYATMELGKLISRKSFTVTIDASELGTLYNIGDVVSCVSIRFGVSFHARITGVKYKMDIRGEKTEIILGEPKLTVIDEVKLTTRIPVKTTVNSDNTNIPVYKGTYTVIPNTSDQTLETAGMLMEQDTLIEEIPYSVVSNNSGGTTATIG